MTDQPLVQSPEAVTDAPKLRRNLSIWEAIGVSVALMAPSMAININPQGTVGLVGRAVPLTFAIATVAVLLIAYTPMLSLLAAPAPPAVPRTSSAPPLALTVLSVPAPAAISAT